MDRPCATPGCTVGIPPQQGSARPRKYCTTCRPPRNRKNPRVVELPKPVDERPAPGQPATKTPPLVESYRKQLEEAERLDTPEGALVLHLAMLFALGQHTAAGAASLSRELRAAMDVALRGAPAKADAVDELMERRRAKAASA